VIPRLREAIADYLERTNPLCDQPSVRVLRAIAHEDAAIDAWGEAALAAAAPEEAADWQRHIDAALKAAGGVGGRAERTTAPDSRHSGPYRFDTLPARDSRFRGIFDTSTPADVV